MTPTRIWICVGPGGVGKTSCAAAMAVRAAQAGLRTLVLTIDPSRRLARTFEIEEGGGVKRVPGTDLPLWASVVDHQKAFDDFVKEASGSSAIFEKVMSNHLFQQMRTNLSGSQDFTSLQTMYVHATSGEFDVVVLDTPPAQHTLDFLDAPEKIAHLFSESVARWFREPDPQGMGAFRRILNLGTRQMLKILEALTGSQFVSELAGFFTYIRSWQNKLVERARAIQTVLVDERTSFWLVTSTDPAKLTESRRLARGVRERGGRLRGLLANRAYPTWWGENEETVPTELRGLFQSYRLHIQLHLDGTDRLFTELREDSSLELHKLREQAEGISNLRDLEDFARQLKEVKL